MMGYIWFAIILVAMIVAAVMGTMGDVTTAIFDSAKVAVTLAIGLGALFLWLRCVAPHGLVSVPCPESEARLGTIFHPDHQAGGV